MDMRYDMADGYILISIMEAETFIRNKKKLFSSFYPCTQYVVVDYLWYRRKVEGAYTDSLGFDVIDEWGRLIPDPERWPSSKGGKGFSEVAKKVHSMGLKFGVHVMRGISLQAFNANTPILNTVKVLTLIPITSYSFFLFSAWWLQNFLEYEIVKWYC